ncbi:MAG: type II toxin-antitoxin system RelE/ParE family toxin [Gammaproteobacteria bacterium]|nr:type II toxin-antitoxin system RelE/ParE family toxin [Gammaproteobacteria bacterium]
MEIQIYQLDNGKLPFDSWLKGLKDQRAKTKILVRLDRLSLGNFGDTKSIDEGVFELRINEGKGYRVYFGRKGGEIVLLLCGGNKSTQQKDI